LGSLGWVCVKHKTMRSCSSVNSAYGEAPDGAWASAGLPHRWGAKKPRVARKWERAWHPWGPDGVPPLMTIEMPMGVCNSRPCGVIGLGPIGLGPMWCH
jgi:hypothetical protein